jgi:integrase
VCLIHHQILKKNLHGLQDTSSCTHLSQLTSFLGALRRAGIEGLRFHDLRHTAATRMIESGASIVAVSKILGHEDLKTTMRYAHPEDSLKDAVELLTKTPFSDSLTDKSTDIGN